MKKALTESEQKFHSFFDHVISGAFQSEPGGKLLLVNDAFVKLFGYRSKAEMSRVNAAKLYVNPADRNKWMKKFKEEGAVRNAELLLKRKDGRPITVLENARTVRDIKGKILYYEGTLTDITKRKQAEEALKASESKFRSFFENTISGAYRTTPEGNLLMVNQAFVKMLGYRSAREVMALNAKQFYENSTDRRQWVQVLITKGSFSNAEVRLKRKDSRVITVLENAQATRDSDGRVLYFQGTVIDITERKRVDQAKTEFVFLASHQLRTPLSAINWYAEVLLADRRGKLTPDQREYLEKIYLSNQRMIDLINDFLNVSQIELGTLKFKYTAINLADRVREIIGEMQPEISKKKIKIVERYGKTKFISSDYDLFTLMVQNLLSNAIKYTPSRGQVTIESRARHQRVVLRIADTGYGIPRAEQGKVFTKFFRAANIKEKNVAGTGLGLYAVKSIVEQLGGRVRFHSEENRGATFYLELPIARRYVKKVK